MTKIQLKNIVKEALNSLKEQSQVFPQACADPVYYYQATQGITQVPLVNPAQLVSTSYVQDALAACCNNPSDPNCLQNNTNLIVQFGCCNYIDACAEFGSLSQSNQSACCEKCQATLPILPSDPCYQYCDCCDSVGPSTGPTTCSDLPGYGTAMEDSCCEKCATNSVTLGVGDPCEEYCNMPQCCGQSSGTGPSATTAPLNPSMKQPSLDPVSTPMTDPQLVSKLQKRAGINRKR